MRRDMQAIGLRALVCVLAGGPVLAQERDPDSYEDPLTQEALPLTNKLAMQCLFETECFEAEACAPSAYAPSMEGGSSGFVELDGQFAQVQWTSDAGTVDLLGIYDGAVWSFAGGGVEARHLLTVGEAGAARYSVHFANGPLFVHYLGTCEVLE